MKLPTRTKPQQRRRHFPIEDARAIKASVYKQTGLRLDLDRLGDDELGELRRLESAERKADTVQRWERLVEKAADHPGFFAADRADKKAEEAARAARMKPRATKLLTTPGTVQIPAVVFTALQNKEMSAVHFLLIMLVVASVQNGAGVHPFMQVVDGAVVVDSPERLISPIDLDGDVSHIAQAVKEMRQNGQWLVVEQAGTTTFRLGPLLEGAA